MLVPRLTFFSFLYRLVQQVQQTKKIRAFSSYSCINNVIKAGMSNIKAEINPTI